MTKSPIKFDVLPGDNLYETGHNKPYLRYGFLFDAVNGALNESLNMARWMETGVHVLGGPFDIKNIRNVP